MAERRTVVLICDLCGSESDTQTHRVALDRKMVELEICLKCRGRYFDKVVVKLLEAGRRVKIPARMLQAS